MISRDLARRLRDAGLPWHPDDGDRFFIPERGMDERVFSISEMTVDVRAAPGGNLIAFNGTVEWALDAIQQREVVWLPTESQLREHLGSAFAALHRLDDGRLRCETVRDGRRRTFTHVDAAEAYGLALLDLLAARPRARV